MSSGTKLRVQIFGEAPVSPSRGGIVHYLAFRDGEREGLAASADGDIYRGLYKTDKTYPGPLDRLIRLDESERIAATSHLLSGSVIDASNVDVLQPITSPGKIICVGLNYRDHANESGFEAPSHPTLFARFTTSLTNPCDPIVKPNVSEQLDYEGELVAVIGKGGRHIKKQSALDHVCGYSIFNDGSVRDYQRRGVQWTLGKNFDRTGAFGPVFVTADALPTGASGLKIETRLNGTVMQTASTNDLIFDIATLVTEISQAITLETGDLIVTGTPAGVGAAHKPPIFMKSGDTCEVEIERIGILRSRIVDEAHLKDNI